MKHQHRGDAADESHAAPHREIDLSREENHEHPECERARDRELDDELREIARTEKRGLPQRKKHTHAQQRERHGEVLE